MRDTTSALSDPSRVDAGWVDVALSSNSRVCSSRALDELGWTPRGPELLDDLEFGSYKRLWSHKGDPHA